MRRSLPMLALIALLAAAPAARAVTFTEDFEDGAVTGGWTYHSPSETVEMSGGNPGRYLHAWNLDTFAPQPETAGPSVFTGDYRAQGVTAIGIDLITRAVDFSAEGRPLSLILVSNNGTPGDPTDDWGAYTMGPDIPVPGEGWRSFQFSVPASATSLPAGWQFIPFGPGAPASPDWNQLITDVSTVRFFYGDATGFFIFQMWDVGLDNVSIEYQGATAVSPATWGGVRSLFR